MGPGVESSAGPGAAARVAAVRRTILELLVQPIELWRLLGHQSRLGEDGGGGGGPMEGVRGRGRYFTAVLWRVWFSDLRVDEGWGGLSGEPVCFGRYYVADVKLSASKGLGRVSDMFRESVAASSDRLDQSSARGFQV